MNNKDGGGDHGDLTRSLKQLSLTTSSSSSPGHATSTNTTATTTTTSLHRQSTNSPRSPRPPTSLGKPSPAPARRRSPGTPTTAGGGVYGAPPRSPAARAASVGGANGSSTDSLSVARSRSSTPTLLRKASMSSIHSSSGFTPSRAPSRRASAHVLTSPVGGGGGGLTMEQQLQQMMLEERPPPTAASVAAAHFRAELDALHQHGHAADSDPDALVVLHDSCYGHRYARPRTSRAALSTIVERPERILASVLGVALAYVRLGERHADGAFPPHPKMDLATLTARGRKLPFRIHKTTRRVPLVSQTVTNVHGLRWMEELKAMCDSAEAKLTMNGKELQRPEMERGNGGGGAGPSGSDEPPQKLHEGDLYLCAESLEALEGALGAVCEAVDAVFAPSGPSRAFVAIRPPGHHCSVSHPSGFCWVNNVHVGIMHAMLQHGLTHAAILDFDLHHGDGSQQIAWRHNARAVAAAKNAAVWKRTSIGYFSLHDINSYPCEMGDDEKVKNASLCVEGAHGQSVWNVHLQPWASDTEFWALYESKYAVLLEKAATFLRSQTDRWKAAASPGQEPRAAIFLSAGFDASEWEGSGMQRHNVNVPTDFYARITRDVVRLAAETGTSVDGRVVSVLEGGYSDRALASGVFSHLAGLAGDDPAPIKHHDYHTGLGAEMGQRIGVKQEKPAADGLGISQVTTTAPAYDPAWWALAELEKLEAAMATPPLPAQEPRKPRTSTPPTYSSPTQASQAKIVLAPRVRRSISGLSALAGAQGGGSSVAAISRPPSPPPPDVDWTVAAHELSKLLTPEDRTTTSCRPEDLSAEATRARRDRQSLLAPPAAAAAQSAPSTPSHSNVAPAQQQIPVRMGLRERKPAKPIGSIDEEVEERVDRSRRKSLTLGDKATTRTTAQPAPTNGKKARQPGRRNSTASTVTSLGADDMPSPPLTASASESNSARPGSSHSMRTESSSTAVKLAPPPKSGPAAATSASTATSTTSLPVKKIRPTAGPRKDSAKTALPTKAATSSAAQKAGASSTTATNGSAGAGKDAATPADDLDAITTGMRRIKINLITKAQRDAREKGKAAAAAVSGSSSAVTTPVEETIAVRPGPPSRPGSSSRSSTATKSASPAVEPPASAIPPPPARRRSSRGSSTPVRRPSPTKGVVGGGSGSGDAATPASKRGAAVAALPPAAPSASFTPLPDASAVPLPASSPLIPSSSTTTGAFQTPVKREPPPRSSDEDSAAAFDTNGADDAVFIPYQPEGPTPRALPRARDAPPLQWLPPDAAFASPAPASAPTPTPMKRAEVPVFTSTGAIPFAGAAGGGGGGGAGVGKERGAVAKAKAAWEEGGAEGRE